MGETNDFAAPAILLEGMLAEAARAGRLYAEVAAQTPDAELDLHLIRLERPVGDEVEAAAALFLHAIFSAERFRRSVGRRPETPSER